MKRIAFLFIIFVVASCNFKENKIKNIIGESYYGISMTKMNEIDIKKEDIYSLPIHYTVVKKFNDVNDGNEYEIVRYIFKTDIGAHRMFYLIDFTNKEIVDKSSDYNDFFAPMTKEIFGENAPDLEGNNLMELMRY